MPELSVVLGSRQPWPEAEMTIASIYEQACSLDAEIILASAGDAEKPAALATRYPRVQWHAFPGETIYRLRAAAVACATARIVAWTEDHVRVGSDWCARVLAAHAANPSAAAIGGVVDNGHPESAKDWAHHFVIFGPVTSPLADGVSVPLSGAANFSIKRDLLLPLPDWGLAEMFLVQEMRARDIPMAVDPSIVVHHIQPVPLSVLFRYHFHNGRTIAAFRSTTEARLLRLLRLGGCAILPFYLAGLRAVQVWPKRSRRRELVTALPWMLCLTAAQSVGEAVGYLVGGGRSAFELR